MRKGFGGLDCLTIEMRRDGLLKMLMIGGCYWQAFAAGAQLQVVADKEPQCVFGEGTRSIQVLWTNGGDKSTAVKVRWQMFQASSATAMPVGQPQDWKQFEALPHQTVIESATIALPAVKGTTRFIIRWLDESNTVLGKNDVLVYPTNLLTELKPLLGDDETALGVLDPSAKLKPELKNAGIHFVDLEETRLEEFGGKLALIGPVSKSDQEWNGLSARVRKVSAKGIGVVWLQTLPRKRGQLWPSFFSIAHGTNAVVIVQPALTENLSENPQSQLNLVHFCKLALHPQTPAVPDLSATP